MKMVFYFLNRYIQHSRINHCDVLIEFN